MPNDYVYLKNISGTVIKPVTDLAAINMTTTNGIVVEQTSGGTIGIASGYIESCYYMEMVDPGVGAANPDSSYISGGTMYTLLGGYTITQDVPPATAASEYQVPSEKAVRSAIDAYVATGGSNIVAGTAINVDGGQINATEATVEETLKGYTVTPIVGTTNTQTTLFNDQVVMPYDLRGALSLGQAVDVSCAPYVKAGTLTWGSDGFTGNGTWVAASGDRVFGFYDSTHTFPKYATDLKYLFICDIKNLNSTALWPSNAGASTRIVWPTASIQQNETARIAMLFETGTSAYFYTGVSTNAEISNCRQYEVTALTDEAILALANAPDPDAWFRSNARSVNERYLVKPDMVSPWIPIIRMSTNSTALTVGAGLAYAVDVFGGSYTIGVDTFPEDAYGQDAHLELFVKAGSHVTFQPPLSLMDPLQENAGHNITIKFREGRATAHVDDTNYGYIINVPEGTAGTQAGGSLYFAINGSTSNYAIFAAQLDGSTVTTPSVTANKDITIMGNGTDKTFISGTIGAAQYKTLELRDLSIRTSTIDGIGYVYIYNTSIVDNLTVAANSNLFFGSGNNILNSVISGSGKLYSSLGSVITSTNGEGTISGMTFSQGQGFATSDVTLSNITVTGCKIVTSLVYPFQNCYVTVENCRIVDNDNTTRVVMAVAADHSLITIKGSTVVNTSSSDVSRNIDASGNGCVEFEDSVIGGCSLYFGTIVAKGNNTLTADMKANYSTSIGKFVFTSGSTTSLVGITIPTQSKAYSCVGSYDFSTDTITQEGNATFIVGGQTFSLSGCKFKTISTAGAITDVTCGAMDLWSADKAIFASPLDASAATTVQLTGTTFTSGSQISKSPSQIQLPANSINSFSGNTTAAGTKILKAGTIIVGDDRTNPTGSATIEFVGGSTTLSGIGTYIAKDGTNDFVPIAGNVTSVTTSTGTGAGSLQYALTSGTKYAKLANNLVASATFAAATNVVNKDIVTSEYQKVLGGTYSVSSGAVLTVNEATKTATIGGAQLKLVDAEIPSGATVAVSGGGGLAIEKVTGNGGVIDLGGTRIEGYTPYTMQGVTVTGATSYAAIARTVSGAVITDCTFTGNIGGGAFYAAENGTAQITSCVFSGNSNNLSDQGGAITIASGGSVSLTGSTVTDNLRAGTPWDIVVAVGGLMTLTDCTFDGMIVDGTTASLAGQNKVNGRIALATGVRPATLLISSGAVVDLTGNTNATPIAPGGGITFEPGGATVYPSAGQASAYTLGGMTVPTIGNTNVVNLNGTSLPIGSGSSAYASGCSFVSAAIRPIGGELTLSNVEITSTNFSEYSGIFCSAASIVSAPITLNQVYIHGNTHYAAGGLVVVRHNNVVLSGSTITGNTATYFAAFDDMETQVGASVICSDCTLGKVGVLDNSTLTLAGNNAVEVIGYRANSPGNVVISSGASINLTSSINPGGSIVVETGGCTVNGVEVAGGTYTQIVSSGGSAVAS